jgi:hypothetical protein
MRVLSILFPIISTNEIIKYVFESFNYFTKNFSSYNTVIECVRLRPVSAFCGLRPIKHLIAAESCGDNLVVRVF